MFQYGTLQPVTFYRTFRIVTNVLLRFRGSRIDLRAIPMFSEAIVAAAIATCMCRLNEAGPDALEQFPQPVNRSPDFVHYTALQLKSL